MLPAAEKAPTPKSSPCEARRRLSLNRNPKNSINRKYEAFKTLQQIKELVKTMPLPASDVRLLNLFIESADRSFDDLIANLENQRQEGLRAMTLGVSALRDKKNSEIKEKDKKFLDFLKAHDRIVESLRDKASRDALTKLLNNEEFKIQAATYLSLASDGICVLGVIDIRDFKLVNDTHGHLVGDRVIERVGSVIGKHIRTSCREGCAEGCKDCSRVDIRARWGGDEFVFLMTDFDNLSEVTTVVERFRRAVTEDQFLSELGIKIDMGVLAMLFNEQATLDSNELFSKAFAEADELMYRYKVQAKQSGQELPVPVACWNINGGIEVAFEPLRPVSRNIE